MARRAGRSRGRGAVTVRIDGIARLRDRMHELGPDIIEALARAVKESAEAVRDETARTVPRAGGHLAETVDIQYEDGGLAAKVGWSDPTSYYAHFVEHGTRRAPAQPSLGPALEAERARYTARLSDEVRRALR
ncbi:HK97-gp10 family putative phage morphogenesis protein [Streptomyces sp.]|uniref:HK97-gp10 family putative phage morphogenesis protein n=1 Tax=Streptomyces sp. TaxID=1931 RepID=UPI002F3EF905